MLTARTRFKTAVACSLAVASLFLQSPVHSTPSLIPVLNGYFSLGQWYFEGDKSSLGGNSGITFVPALRYSNRFSLIPTIESTYRGTRSAEELAGGSTLFQDTWENGVGLKAVHGFNSSWKVRERIGFRSKWFRETTNEKWNKGLYDYRIFSIGGEVEREWTQKVSAALAYDYSFLKFPNYESLEGSQGSDRAREFAGDNVLDAHIHLGSLRLQVPSYWRTNHQFQALYSPRYYPDQTVVEASGLLTANKREDTYTGASWSGERIFKTSANTNLVTTIRYGYTRFDSNQNHYDARLTTFLANFYDYSAHSFGPQFLFAFGQQHGGPMLLDASYTYSRRSYNTRVIQASDGTYLSDKLRTAETSLILGFSYPLAKNLRLKTTASFGQSRSNNQYEELYQYNYSNSNYQFGFTYDY